MEVGGIINPMPTKSLMINSSVCLHWRRFTSLRTFIVVRCVSRVRRQSATGRKQFRQIIKSHGRAVLSQSFGRSAERVVVEMRNKLTHVQFTWSGLVLKLWPKKVKCEAFYWAICHLCECCATSSEMMMIAWRLLWCGTLQNIRSHASPASRRPRPEPLRLLISFDVATLSSLAEQRETIVTQICAFVCSISSSIICLQNIIARRKAAEKMEK